MAARRGVSLQVGGSCSVGSPKWETNRASSRTVDAVLDSSTRAGCEDHFPRHDQRPAVSTMSFVCDSLWDSALLTGGVDLRRVAAGVGVLHNKPNGDKYERTLFDLQDSRI